MPARLVTLMLLVTLTLGSACDSNRATQPSSPVIQPSLPPIDFSPLAEVRVYPGAVALEQGLSLQLEISAFNERRLPMTRAGTVTFSSSDSAIARVSGSGLVTGVATGMADISATMTVAGISRSAAMKATIHQGTPSSGLTITADLQRGWQPSVAHMMAGGTVQWLTAGPRSWSDVPHRVLYLMDKRYTVVDSLDLTTGSATLKLPTAGEYRYCSAGCWDQPDHGIVYVH